MKNPGSTEGRFFATQGSPRPSSAQEERDNNGYPVLPFEQHSDDLRRNLENCGGVIILAATIGAGIDRLIRRYERTEPATGLLLQGIGAERVETLVDTFNEEVNSTSAELGLKAHAEKRMGITLNSSYMMSPSKSVTAIIGIESKI